ETRNTHGTGCTLAAGIAAHLALGFELSDAVAGAKQFLADALVAGRDLRIGAGRGPVDHLHGIRTRTS
ncbi:MAG: bifunctional hydroxymethylpyrimidine kinase/phosphomethylpyrimidine kinase, partial [Nitrococcus mobilis]|nr:bifunctional hydroxymethylpyrimidine kinase/phosphomethylpyrimidine kinase [Nitrococcus mobilis]